MQQMEICYTVCDDNLGHVFLDGMLPHQNAFFALTTYICVFRPVKLSKKLLQAGETVEDIVE